MVVDVNGVNGDWDRFEGQGAVNDGRGHECFLQGSLTVFCMDMVPGGCVKYECGKSQRLRFGCKVAMGVRL